MLLKQRTSILMYFLQNARSALEAMRCGLPLYIASPHLWPKFVGANSNVTRLCKTPTDPVQVAKDIHQLLLDLDQGFGANASQYFEEHNSPEITVEQFTKLLEIMKKHPKPDQNVLISELLT